MNIVVVSHTEAAIKKITPRPKDELGA